MAVTGVRDLISIIASEENHELTGINIVRKLSTIALQQFSIYSYPTVHSLVIVLSDLDMPDISTSICWMSVIEGRYVAVYRDRMFARLSVKTRSKALIKFGLSPSRGEKGIVGRFQNDFFLRIGARYYSKVIALPYRSTDIAMTFAELIMTHIELNYSSINKVYVKVVDTEVWDSEGADIATMSDLLAHYADKNANISGVDGFWNMVVESEKKARIEHERLGVIPEKSDLATVMRIRESRSKNADIKVEIIYRTESNSVTSGYQMKLVRDAMLPDMQTGKTLVSKIIQGTGSAERNFERATGRAIELLYKTANERDKIMVLNSDLKVVKETREIDEANVQVTVVKNTIPDLMLPTELGMTCYEVQPVVVVAEGENFINVKPTPESFVPVNRSVMEELTNRAEALTSLEFEDINDTADEDLIRDAFEITSSTGMKEEEESAMLRISSDSEIEEEFEGLLDRLDDGEKMEGELLNQMKAVMTREHDLLRKKMAERKMTSTRAQVSDKDGITDVGYIVRGEEKLEVEKELMSNQRYVEVGPGRGVVFPEVCESDSHRIRVYKENALSVMTKALRDEIEQEAMEKKKEKEEWHQ